MSFDKFTIGTLCTITKGLTGIQKAIEGDYPLVVTAEDRKTHNEFQFDDEAVIVPLVSGTGHGHASIKRIHYQDGKFALGSILCAIIPKDKSVLNAQYLFRFLNLYKEDELVARMKGMANVSLPIKEIAKIEIPLPSLEEQHKFIEEYQILEENSKRIDSELETQFQYIKQLRQAYLAEAMQGKLVSNNSPTGEETGQQLLERIKAEKVQLIKDKKLKKEKPLVPIKADEIPFEIPENWVWCRLGEICDKLHYGFNAAGNKLIKDHRLLRITDIQDNVVNWESVPGCICSKTEIESYLLRNNDILIARTGGTIGKTYLVQNISVKSLFASYLIRAVLNNSAFPNFIKYFMESPLYWEQLYASAWGAGQPNVNGSSLLKLNLPLPPLSIQNRVVEKLDELMQHCDGLEESIKASQVYNQQLLQQVLKEALEVREEADLS